MTDKQKMDNPYRFILIAGARTNQLLQGAKARVTSKSMKKTSIALEELKENKLKVTFVESEEVPQEDTDII